MHPATEWTKRRVSSVLDSKPSDHRQWNATGNVNRKAKVPLNRCTSPSHDGVRRGKEIFPYRRRALTTWINANPTATVANHTLRLIVPLKNNVSVASRAGS